MFLKYEYTKKTIPSNAKLVNLTTFFSEDFTVVACLS